MLVMVLAPLPQYSMRVVCRVGGVCRGSDSVVGLLEMFQLTIILLAYYMVWWSLMLRLVLEVHLLRAFLSFSSIPATKMLPRLANMRKLAEAAESVGLRWLNY